MRRPSVSGDSGRRTGHGCPGARAVRGSRQASFPNTRAVDRPPSGLAVVLSATEDGVDVRQAGEPRERALGRDLLRGREEAGPRGARKRTPDTDPADAEGGG